MNTYKANSELLNVLLQGRQYSLKEQNEQAIWINDIAQVNARLEIEISIEEREGWLKMSKGADEGTFGFLQLDGTNGVFRIASPPVADTARFSFEKVYGYDEEKKIPKTKTVTAGSCDCLFLKTKWHFFEFKTGTTTRNNAQANENRKKAELQLGRTLTFFKERAASQNIPFNAACECVLVTNPSFPKIKAANINQAIRFFGEFDARLTEVQTNQIYQIY